MRFELECWLTERWSTNKSLILRARNPDDAQAWGDFVHFYKPFMLHVLRRMNVPQSDSEDVVQDILVKIWRSIASYDAEKGRFRTWLSTVVRNAVFDQFTKVGRRRELEEKEAAAFQMLKGEPASEIDRRIEQEWARHVTSLALERIQKLFSAEAVSCFTMSLDETPATAIAAELNLAVDSVYTLKSRVKARFIKEIKAIVDELEG